MPYFEKEKTKNIPKINESFTSKIAKDSRILLDDFEKIIKMAMPLSQKQERLLNENLKQLFFHLTTDRSDRRINYLNNSESLSAYIYHYMQWNLFRLVKILSAIDLSYLKDDDYIGDFGSGPLTLACALWISKPELRNIKLNIYCIDNSSKALSIGEEIFLTLCAYTKTKSKNAITSWKIIKITDSFGVKLRHKLKLYTSANLFNEFFSNSKIRIFDEAKKITNIIKHYLLDDGNIFIVEPGIPLGGELISAFRTIFLADNFIAEQPCTHNNICTLPATKSNRFEIMKYSFAKKEHKKIPIAFNKWCHFVLSVEDAPVHLKQFSENVNLQKENVAISFVYCTKNKPSKKTNTFNIRVTSDIFKLPENYIGRYACSQYGFLLLRAHNKNTELKNAPSGSLLELNPILFKNTVYDKKSGAKIIDIF